MDWLGERKKASYHNIEVQLDVKGLQLSNQVNIAARLPG